MDSSGLICHYGVDLMIPHLFKKNETNHVLRQLSKNTRTLYMYRSRKWHGVNINMPLTFFEVKNFFKKNQTNGKFDLFKKL